MGARGGGIIWVVCLLAGGFGCRGSTPVASAQEMPLPESPAPAVAGMPISGFWNTWGRPLDDCLREHRARRRDACHGVLAVTVRKGARRLVVSCDGEPVKGYFVALGRSPSGAKERRGDGRTPEGTYYICNRLPRSSFHLSLRLAYPNAADAERGLREHLIDARTYRRILSALRQHHKPPQNTPLGGDICIHGGGIGTIQEQDGTRYVRVQDWTEGCIALCNQDIEELCSRLPIGTPVQILP